MDKQDPPTSDTFTLPISLMQSILDYLQGRPYRETAGLINEVLKHNPPPKS